MSRVQRAILSGIGGGIIGIYLNRTFFHLDREDPMLLLALGVLGQQYVFWMSLALEGIYRDYLKHKDSK